ncbi:MAG: exopolysaccharide biosynthesis protein [Maricaulaceae bacterium]
MTDAGVQASLTGALLRLAEPLPEDGAITLDDLIAGLGTRAFGATLFALALPCCIPFLYGVPQIVALPMAALAGQMTLGRPPPRGARARGPAPPTPRRVKPVGPPPPGAAGAGGPAHHPSERVQAGRAMGPALARPIRALGATAF